MSDSGAASWTLAWRLARRELRSGVRGFRVFLACLTVGVAAIAAVGSTSSGITASLGKDAREILGGDVAVRLVQRPAKPDEENHLTTTAQLSRSAEMRAMAQPDSAGFDGARSLVELKAVDASYPLYGTLETAPPLARAALFEQRNGLWGTIIAPALVDRLGVAVGDVLRVGDGRFEIRAVLTREPDRLAGSGVFLLGPRVMISKTALAATGLEQPGSLIYYTYKVALPQDIDPEDWIADLNTEFPDAGWRIRRLDEAAPQIRRLVQRVSLFLTFVGLTALLVGGVGVANAVSAYLDGKTAVIATLKCLGAPARLIVRLYLLQILTLAAVGIAAGLILGALAPFAASGAIAAFLPVPVSIGLYPNALLIAALFGLLTAVSFGLWPVARASQIPAGSLFRNLVAPTRSWPATIYVLITAGGLLALAGLAIATADDAWLALWFVVGAAAAMLTFRIVASLIAAAARRVGNLRQPALRLAVAALHRPGTPTPSVVLALGLGLSVLVTIAQIDGNLSRQIREELPTGAPAFFFIDLQPDQVAPFETLLASIDGVEQTVQVPMLRGRITGIDGTAAESAVIDPNSRWAIRGDRGVTWSRTAPENSPVVEGEWWQADYAGPLLVSLDADIAAGFGVGIGDTLAVNVLGREFTATIANLRHIDWQTLSINFVMIFSPGPLEAAPRSHIAIVHADAAAEAEIERSVTNAFHNVSAVRVRDALETVNGIVTGIGTAVRLAALVALVAGTLVLAGAIAASHRRRVYDSVVLKVLGATRRNVMAIFILEYGLLGLVTASLASIVGSIAAWAVLRFLMGIDWVLMPQTIAVTVIGATLIILAIGVAGTWHTLGQKTAPLLRHE
ncbi:MAG: FtsX-like permease family protein [Alphaproteobacteria bacterium]|nr:FtsX-like permease family protein [Alphaproteobacteria bacterium]